MRPERRKGGWEVVPGSMCYEGQPIYRNRGTGELAFEANGERLVELPCEVYRCFLIAFNIDLLTYRGEEAVTAELLDTDECHLALG